MKKASIMVLKILGIVIVVALIGGFTYLRFNPQFGGKITKKLKEQYAQSEQWDGEKFVNTTETSLDMSFGNVMSLLKTYITDTTRKAPLEKLPLQAFNAQAWNDNDSAFQFIWFGHSVGMMKMAGKTILIDPMFGDDTSPVGPVSTKRYSDSTLQIIEQLPQIDAVCITHDHYDHLDYDSFLLLKDKVKHFYVPLGVKRHLLRWGIADERISSFDWWENTEIEGVTMTFVPSRHFSGRGLSDRAKSLWGGWVFTSAKANIYWSGDGGYGEHFKEIGEKLGPFDYGFVECGQYNKRWHAIHMYPEESVQAAIDAKIKVSIPIHWGAFTLALHRWKDPVERFTAEAKKRNVTVAMPKLGERIDFEVAGRESLWWERVK